MTVRPFNDPHIFLTLGGPGEGTFFLFLTPNDSDPPRDAVGNSGIVPVITKRENLFCGELFSCF